LKRRHVVLAENVVLGCGILGPRRRDQIQHGGDIHVMQVSGHGSRLRDVTSAAINALSHDERRVEGMPEIPGARRTVQVEHQNQVSRRVGGQGQESQEVREGHRTVVRRKGLGIHQQRVGSVVKARHRSGILVQPHRPGHDVG